MALKLKMPAKLIPATHISYYDLDAEIADITLAATDRIHQRLLSAKMDIVEIGKDLMTVKERLAHGMFECWVDREFQFGKKTAENYMKAARLASETSPEVIELLPQKVVYELAAKSTPVALKNAILTQVEATGTPPETADVLKLIADAKKAKTKKAKAINVVTSTPDTPAMAAAKMLKKALGSHYGSFRALMLEEGPPAFWMALDELEAEHGTH
ncbi:DUF3102 domain-containing protein [Rhizobium deserti]|uniref:DUF3102 domain-containing protein n=1 Tax=Rhizobium deserti TaxID=2547961 RepID=A0A4R5UJU1_9HYPH|nr:DUF3102 domain-containing protein [Rhizobium deserti]TDK37023.1 DUF3102 domain-containing protein [Rhizobium deserti]